jgi:hypothetical protein
MALGKKTGGRVKGTKNKRTLQLEGAGREAIQLVTEALGERAFKGDAHALLASVYKNMDLCRWSSDSRLRRRPCRYEKPALSAVADRLHCGRMAHYILDLASFRNAKNRDIVDVFAYQCGSPQRICDRYDGNAFHWCASDLALDPVSGHSLFGYHAHCARQSNQPGPRCARDCNCSQRVYPAQFQPSRTAHHPRMLGGSGRGLFRSWILSLYWRLARL